MPINVVFQGRAIVVFYNDRTHFTDLHFVLKIEVCEFGVECLYFTLYSVHSFQIYTRTRASI